MRILPLAIGGLFLLGTALPALAQTTEPAPLPKFYVGLGAYSSFYQKLGGQPYRDGGFQVPVQLVAGYQVRPRIALQLGVAYSGISSSYFSDGYLYGDPTTRPTFYQYQERSTLRTTSVSVLARYTLTRNPAHRLQFDVLAGFGLEHLNAYTRGTQKDSIPGYLQTTPYSYRGTQNTFLLTFGGAARYRLSQRFELNLDVAANRTLYFNSPATGVQSLTSSTSLGLRYRFGQR